LNGRCIHLTIETSAYTRTNKKKLHFGVFANRNGIGRQNLHDVLVDINGINKNIFLSSPVSKCIWKLYEDFTGLILTWDDKFKVFN